MGACSSCLGLNRRNSQSDPSDTSQLLGEAYPPHYGSTITSQPVADPEEIRRQRDVLERLCVSTSDKLIDVTTATHPPEASEASGLKPAHEYPRIFSERFAHLGHLHFGSEPASRSASITQCNTDAPQSSRPPSSGPSESRDAEVTDEESWLASILKHITDEHQYDDDGLPWDQVLGAEHAKGSLAKKFFGDPGMTRQAIKA